MGRTIDVALLATLAGGCNAFYGLTETRPVDAAIFDAPNDAPYQCPGLGARPTFGSVLVQVTDRNCQLYTTSPDRQLAAARCSVGPVDTIETGPIDGELQPATLTGAPGELSFVRLTPEGDELWVRRLSAGVGKTTVYSRSDDHTWTFVRDLALPPSSRDDSFSAPTRRVGGVRRFLVHRFSSDVVEYTDDGTTTTLVRTYAPPDLGSPYVILPNLTADGLRIVFAGEPTSGPSATQTMYAERSDPGAPFPAASPLATAPVAFDAFLSEDCGRLYTSGLGYLFYASQR